MENLLKKLLNLTPKAYFMNFNGPKKDEYMKILNSAEESDQLYLKAMLQEFNEKNYQKAIELYEKAIELGNSWAMNNLGVMYDKGEGVEQDYQKAKELYEKAIKLGNSQAMNNLGIMYDKGNGVNQDYQKAIELYKKAAELDNDWGTHNLANMYRLGNGVNLDHQKAIELYEKAIILGNKTSLTHYKQIYDEDKFIKNAIQLGKENESIKEENEKLRARMMDLETSMTYAPGSIEYQKAMERFEASQKLML